MQLQYYKEKFKLKNCTFLEVSSSEGMVSHSFHVYRNNKPCFFLKIFPRKEDFKRELYFLSLFGAKVLVPKVFDKVSGDEKNLPAILMEALEGESLGFELQDEGLASQIGKSLALLHEVKTEFYGDLT